MWRRARSKPASTAVTVVDVPITGLRAASSPTTLGTATFFTATIGDGTNATYVWDFGDGDTGSGATVTHIYVALGAYTATVTATNGAGSVSAANGHLYRLGEG